MQVRVLTLRLVSILWLGVLAPLAQTSLVSADTEVEPPASGPFAMGDVRAADTPVVGDVGEYGYHYLPDYSSSPGILCYHTLPASGSDRTRVVIKAPVIYAADYYYWTEYQTVAWYATVFEVPASGDPIEVWRSAVSSATAADYAPAPFSDLSVNLPIGKNYVVVASMGWYLYGSLVGAAHHLYDYYGVYFRGDSGSVYAGLSVLGCNPGLFTSPPARMTLSRTRINVDSSVSISVTGFPSNAPVNILWDGAVVKTVQSAIDGSFVTSWKIPPATAGPHTITAVSGTRSVSATITVVAKVRLKPTSGPTGTSVIVYLRGYAAGESVTVRWYNGTRATTIATVKTSSTGSKNLIFSVPSNAAAGDHLVRGDGNRGNAAKATFVVTAATASVASTATPAATPAPSPTATPTATLPATATPEPSPTMTPIAGASPTATPTGAPATPSPAPEESPSATPADATGATPVPPETPVTREGESSLGEAATPET
ncbi:MAG: hypothetical protein KatS3mg059_1617 [Thermomicrobiales bacterium]|nr:MAG: hypothetical protein KatS3mg059_1617 [Thermomicrobiales bacterium]